MALSWRCQREDDKERQISLMLTVNTKALHLWKLNLWCLWRKHATSGRVYEAGNTMARSGDYTKFTKKQKEMVIKMTRIHNVIVLAKNDVITVMKLMTNKLGEW